MLDISFINGTMIFLALLVCSFVGATSGGVGLMTIPICIFFGFSPQVAVATTRVGVLGSTIAGWNCFNKRGHISYKIGIYGAICAAIGAYIGAQVMIDMSPIVLKRMISFFMIVSLIFIAVGKSNSKTKKSEELAIQLLAPKIHNLRKIAGYISLLFVGFLGGMFGGLGVIINSILVLFFNKTFIEASGTRFIIVFATALMAVYVYQAHDSINWSFVAITISSMTIGTYLGSIYGIKKGEKWIKNLSYIVITLVSIRLFFF